MSFGQNYNLFSDLNELERMIGSLEGYLKSNNLYGSVGGGFLTGGTAPQLTPGAILLRIRRLNALRDQLDDRRQATLDKLIAQHNTIRTRYETPYQERLVREAHSRLDAMKRFFEECREDMSNCPRIYNPEVLRRTIVEEVLDDLNAHGYVSSELDQKIIGTDKRLRGYLAPADYVWDNQLQAVYPQDKFWWQWMAPPTYR